MGPLPSSLIFPETEPSVHDIGKLLFFFNSLSYYLPTEPKNADNDNHGPFHKLCAGYAPAPLAEDLDRFNSLLREMKNSRPDELAGLFSAARSPIATGQIRDKDETSSGSVLTALQDNTAQQAETLFKERLWQARLILKLAEIIEKNEKEVNQGLARLDSSEQKIYASLEGQNDTEPAEMARLKTFSKASSPQDFSRGAFSMLNPIRVKAWAELFLADSSPNRPSILVATSLESAGILLDGYENNWKKIPQKLFTLSIPVFPDSLQYLEARDKLRSMARKHLDYFADFLGRTSENQAQAHIDQGHVDAWEDIIKTGFPSQDEEYQKLDFYSFPGISLQMLLKKSCSLEPLTGVENTAYTTSILAVLSG